MQFNDLQAGLENEVFWYIVKSILLQKDMSRFFMRVYLWQQHDNNINI